MSSSATRSRTTRLGTGVLAGAALLAATLASTVTPASALNPITDTRFSGANRYDTARQTALAAYPGGATNVVLARGDLFPDALAGSYLAGTHNGPVLLTPTESLHAEALAGLNALGATTVHLVGSEGAISANVRDQLTGAGFATTRAGGDNRYHTAALAATAPGPGAVGTLPGFGKTAIVASGENFPDALAAGPIAHRAKFPLLLTPRTSLATETAGALPALGIAHVLLIGGTSAVTDDVRNAIVGMGITVDRREGADRFATAANLATFSRTTLGWTIDDLVLATGFNFPDAVAAGPLGGVRQAPIVLTDDPLPAPSVGVCSSNQPTLTHLFVEGSTSIVTNAAVNACRAAGEGPVIIPPPASLSGYVWANQQATAAYTPSTAYQFNSTGATNTVSRSGTGVYSVTFPGLGVDAGTVSVNAYGSNARCKTSGWNAVGTELVVGVRCFSPAAGAPVDSRYVVSFQRPAAGAGPRGFVWANDASSAAYTPTAAYQFNSTGATNTITRSGAGAYQVTLPGLASAGGHVQVTAYGTGMEHCKVNSWDASGANELVNVRCYNAAGAATDSRFTMTFVSGTRLLSGVPGPNAYLWANDESAAVYVPSLAYQFNSASLAGNATRSGAGSYTVTLPGVGGPGGHVQVTAYGSGSDHCTVDEWGPVGADLSVDVSCFSTAGPASDSRFTVAWVS